jgi:hypothetical protein
MAIRNNTNLAKPTGNVVTGQVPPNFKGTLILRIKEATFGPSKSSQQPQITWKTEVVSPLEWKSDYEGENGNTYSLDSKEINMYLSLSEVKKDGSPSDNLDYIVNTLHPKLGLPAEIDDENPNLDQYKGLCFQVIAETQERLEQRKKPDGTYEQIKDSDGNPISRGWEWKMIGMKDVLKKASAEAGRQF